MRKVRNNRLKNGKLPKSLSGPMKRLLAGLRADSAIEVDRACKDIMKASKGTVSF